MQSVQELSTRVDRLETDVRKTIDKLRDQMNQIRNRPPVWASLLISLLTFGLGIMASAALRR
jgi:hypothetical protein